MPNTRPLRWLACGALVALAAGCGDHAARVLAPSRTSRATAANSASVRPPGDATRLSPCNPSYLGPVLSLSGPGLDYQYPTGGFCACPEAEVPLDVPEQQAVTFHWSADASGGCTEVRWYRWALDIADVADETPRTDEATDWTHWSVRSLATSATVGPFALTAGGTNVHRLYVDVMDELGYRSLGIVRIQVVAVSNRPPDVASATARLAVPGPPNGAFSPVVIDGVTDPDGDPVTLSVTGVTQDEPLVGTGERPTCPDAAIVGGAASVRREATGTGNGRVYTIAFLAQDGRGGSSAGSATVCIPRNRGAGGGCVQDALVVSSLGACEPAMASLEP